MSKIYKSNKYVPEQQDIIWIDFMPSKGQEIRGRHPALVLSLSNYSLQTGLVMVMPITHAKHNRLKRFFVPVHTDKIEGYVNPLQTFTFSIKSRHVEFTGEILPTADWAKALTIHQQIIGIE